MKIAITTHQKPDADAMGSSLGLYNFLVPLGHDVTVISPTNWANWVSWMPGSKKVVDYEMHKEKAELTLDKADWLFCLDFNDFSRTKSMAPKLRSLKTVKILIDHHEEPDEASFDFGVSDATRSSTCELLYDFILGSGYKDRITREVAECIYAGVVADTGSFRFPNVSAHVHRLVADLKDKGLLHTPVHEALYDNFLENRLRFIGNVLSNRMEIFYEFNSALIAIPKSDLLKFNIKTGDTEGLVNYPMTIQGIKLVALVVDRDEERKWSFRSKGDFDCNAFARQHFDGGGHFNAAGGRSSESLTDTVKKFKKVIKEYESLL